MQVHPLIETNAALADFCGLIRNSDFIAVDTEFMRENTFWPELCLIQVADREHAAAIDPLVPGMDLKPLLDLLVDNEDMLKVFHAGGQDVEIIFNLTGKTPHPIFDTQIGQMAIGQAEQVGYSNLVEAWIGLQLDKGARFTDWSRRPLDKRQIDYAVGDVTHLAKIFPMMLDKLVKTGRGHWLYEEMEKLADPANYSVDPDKAWHRIKIPSRKPDVLGRLQALAAWREREARSKNLPRGRIVKDETLADLAAHPPKDQDGLGRVRGLSATWRSNDIGARLMDALASARPMDKDDMPDRAPRGPGVGKEGVRGSFWSVTTPWMRAGRPHWSVALKATLPRRPCTISPPSGKNCSVVVTTGFTGLAAAALCAGRMRMSLLKIKLVSKLSIHLV